MVLVMLTLVLTAHFSFRSGKVMSNIIHKLEKFIGDKYPVFIVKVLDSCAFNLHSLSLLNENTIEEIEKLIRKNPELVKDSIYEKNDITNFEFKLGHRLLLLNIPNTIKLYREQKTKESKSPKSIDAKSKNVVDSKIIDLKSSALLTKLENYEKKFNLKLSVTREHIKDFKETNSGFKCTINCPRCDTTFTCYNNSGDCWIVSNFTNHSRLHLGLHIQKPSEKPPNIKVIDSNSKALQAILNVSKIP